MAQYNDTSGDLKGRQIALLLLVLVVFAVGSQTVPLYSDWLWFEEVKLPKVFLTVLTTQLTLAVAFGLIFAILVYVNLYMASRLTTTDVLLEVEDRFGLPSRLVIEPYFRPLLIPGAFGLGVLSAFRASAAWEHYIRFANAQPFGIADPIFQEDVGFYVFKLPFLSFLYSWLITSVVLILLLTAVTYLLFRGIQITARGPIIARPARTHLLVLAALLFLIKAVGYRLDTYQLLYAPGGMVFGAGYSAINANLPALNFLTTLAIFVALLCLAQIFYHGWKLVLVGLGMLVVGSVIGLGLYPGFIQRFRVVPNEIVAESPYITHNIQFTRQAYGLDRIEEREFPAEETLTREELRRNDLTIKNIRLWDHRPLLTTYGQLQEIRTYYKFMDVDNDRYLIDGEYRQVMLSAREMSYQHLPGRSWINEHLIFTHGYGVVFGPVNRITPEGLPEFLIKDIPPVSTTPIKVTRPEIYFGEVANDYVIVKTQAQELDYPSGDKNVYSTYTGEGGVPLTSLGRKLLFATRFGTLKFLLSKDLTSDSRIMYHRQISERVKKAAPFLTFDRDAYLVIARDGRLFWIIDAYTTSDMYPYSEPIRGVGNYIRNSVKAVVDAYNGSVSFYMADPTDPVIKAYDRAFPGLFQPLEAMPDDLKAHLRYPQGMFNVQARLYSTYHMRDPQVFYNKEDLWSIPAEMEPYYTIMRLPDETKEEFILLLPFTPNKKDNMIAWLAARSDPPHYGKLTAFNFPKAKLVYGPRQINARIDQDSFISQQLSLWSQRGSTVIRGSMLAIPIERSLLYVQPLYLAAEKGSLPELKRIIVAHGNQIAMEENLESALARVFGGAVRGSVEARIPSGAGAPPAIDSSLKALAARASDHFTRAQELLRQGNFAGYGEEVKRLESALKELRTRAAK
ncbi:hypothetical protein MELA_01414 [Candidatus Methylomirabilis lanthanidiphila]|uniref:UPF0182 protein MELA_01414 n=1 Tax=Candidatus Methylomirabilis lanthanidiphila TaxID=2211376 RepID=A0A564ZI75_9BACT|nr:UPF0182 family protein [Candidatus Methylomirabilis lanthanidiphila]VUZ85039.1 hypothetical protein MELA_01414 [Candidatus Methylomirabilis lanthanidiphila]